MRQDVYLHALHASSIEYSSKKTLELLEKILKSGALLSSRQSGQKCGNNFSGCDHISLCDYERRNRGKGFKKTYNAFYQYAVFDPSIMLPKGEFEVIEPIVLPKMIMFYSGAMSVMKELGMSEERYTDLEDEVQVKDRVSIEKMCGFTMPTYEFLRMFKSVEHDAKVTYQEVLKYKELLDKYGYNVPFYDINTEHPMDTYDEVYETVLKLKKRK